MTIGFWIFDLLLSGLLLWFAWRLLASRDLFKGVVLFIIFGLLMALTYARLRAPDVALAEAAVGAGVTGALFLNALGRMRTHGKAHAVQQTGGKKAPAGWIRISVSVCCIVLFAAISWSIFALPDNNPEVSTLVQEHMIRSGVENPVTAVLLNFRSYDTLLEIGVLVLSLLALLALGGHDSPAGILNRESIALNALVRIILPVMIITGAYLLWRGANDPGGAFQGGAIIGSALIVLMLTNTETRQESNVWPVRVLAVSGFLVFLIISAALLVRNGLLLEYPHGAAGIFILIIEAVLTVSIAFVLAILFAGRLNITLHTFHRKRDRE